ncbi:MFS transporter [Actinomycetospora sp. CA-084318]|uniref:MFS transporter n=1 Tax=Actinomycetospora sp. CA-084318 TaxID=3239892 RepID=UPI003D95A359
MRRWMPLVAVCLGTFMLLVDVTIVNVALPATAVDLDTSFGALQWVVDGYALALAALLLGAGGIADRVGHRTTYVAGTVVFAVASLGCGLAVDPGMLIASRVVQGVGGAAMIATTFALLNGSYTGVERARAYAVWGAVSGASSAVGPLLGGPLTQALSWRWIFFVNLPVSAVAVVVSVLVLPVARPTGARRIDVAGIVVLTAAIATLTAGMIRASDDGWASPTCWGPLALGVLLLAGFAAIERVVAEPLLDLALLRHRVFGGVLLAALLLNGAAYVSLTFASLWMQSVLRLTPVTAGLVALPMSVAAFAASLATPRLLRTLAAGTLIGLGLLLVGAGDLLGAVLMWTLGVWPALPAGFLLVGVGVGLATAPLGSTGTGAVPADRAGMAGGAVYTARQVGVAFGVALLGSVFAAATRSSLVARGAGSLAHDVVGGRAAEALAAAPAGVRSALEGVVEVAVAHGMAALLAVAGLAGLAGAVVAWTVVRDRRAPTPDRAPAMS